MKHNTTLYYQNKTLHTRQNKHTTNGAYLAEESCFYNNIQQTERAKEATLPKADQ